MAGERPDNFELSVLLLKCFEMLIDDYDFTEIRDATVNVVYTAWHARFIVKHFPSPRPPPVARPVENLQFSLSFDLVRGRVKRYLRTIYLCPT